MCVCRWLLVILRANVAAAVAWWRPAVGRGPPLAQHIVGRGEAVWDRVGRRVPRWSNNKRTEPAGTRRRRRKIRRQSIPWLTATQSPHHAQRYYCLAAVSGSLVKFCSKRTQKLLLLLLLSGWPPTWKTWKSQGIWKWSGGKSGKICSCLWSATISNATDTNINKGNLDRLL